MARTHFLLSITYCEDGNAHSGCRVLKSLDMILKINLADSKIMTMVANFFVTIEKVKFFPNTIIYKKNQAHPPRGRDSFHRHQVYLIYQPIGETPWNPSQ